MSRVKALRAAIQDFLKSVHPRVHYHRADPNGAYPRLVFDLPTSFDDGNFEIFQLEVDGWDNNPDTSALEDLMAAMDGDGGPGQPDRPQQADDRRRQPDRAGVPRATAVRSRRRPADPAPAIHLPGESL